MAMVGSDRVNPYSLLVLGGMIGNTVIHWASVSCQTYCDPDPGHIPQDTVGQALEWGYTGCSLSTQDGQLLQLQYQGQLPQRIKFKLSPELAWSRGLHLAITNYMHAHI